MNLTCLRAAIGLCLLAAAGSAVAESAAQRRLNEARGLDLKIEQRQILRREGDFAGRRSLEGQFERERFDLRQLQLRQIRNEPDPDQAELRRFEQQQQGKELDLKNRRQDTGSDQPEVQVFEFKTEPPFPGGFNNR